MNDWGTWKIKKTRFCDWRPTCMLISPLPSTSTLLNVFLKITFYLAHFLYFPNLRSSSVMIAPSSDPSAKVHPAPRILFISTFKKWIKMWNLIEAKKAKMMQITFLLNFSTNNEVIDCNKVARIHSVVQFLLERRQMKEIKNR